MKKIFLVLLAVVAVLSVQEHVFSAQNTLSTKVTAYYFHTTFRCSACTMIENYVREAIETNFQEELESGALSFKEINIENKENQHFINQYQLYTKSVILSVIKEDKEVQFKNLDKIWQLVRNKQGFMDYITNEVRNLLKEVP